MQTLLMSINTLQSNKDYYMFTSRLIISKVKLHQQWAENCNLYFYIHVDKVEEVTLLECNVGGEWYNATEGEIWAVHTM